ncbi:hypothetical protein J8J40_33020, partial [Mycobacterium tuberculosis]|nr:hypothetical protein [Mycobacterium tuberculosis]
LSGERLSPEFQGRLDSVYAHAFALSRAKGVADACWLEMDTPQSNRRGYGLPGNFAAVKEKIKGLTARNVGVNVTIAAEVVG